MRLARVSLGAPPRRWQVRVPGSKSITNRAILLAALATGESTLRAPLLADDTRVMAAALQALGASVRLRDGRDWVVGGLAGPPTTGAELWCGMAGTVGRFLLPALAAGRGRFRIDAHEQLRRRPLAPVLDALRAQGARIDGEALPLTLTASGLAGGELAVDTSASSQFLSGLLIAAPFARTATTLRFETLVSRPYLELTVDAMRAFGVEPIIGDGAITVEPAVYRATELAVEPDASTASYFLARAAITGTTAALPGLDLSRSHQGDLELARLLARMGCAVVETGTLELTGPARLRGIEVDMSGSSDVFMTLACVAPFAESATTIEGIGHARAKESDRVAATAENLRRLGIAVDEGRDHLRVHPGAPRPARLPTYDDHRIAMAFALIGARVPVELEDPDVVAKTCPTFWELWRRTGATVELVEGAPA